jgi:phosphoenolpyruvate carboxykinase (ATP)
MLEKSSLVYGLSREELVNHAVQYEGAKLTASGVLSVQTGARTGRSRDARYIVADNTTNNAVHWGDVNRPFKRAAMDKIWDKAMLYLAKKKLFASTLQVGASSKYALQVEVVTEYAWHQLYLRNLFIREVATDIPEYSQWTLVSLPEMALSPEVDGVTADVGLFIDISKRRVLLCGLKYAGEMKKAFFSVLNYVLPTRGVLPMHCAANQSDQGDVCLFFGLSGTGKTTLSADPKRQLIGDDEHGWYAEGVFNFEGGCYAKCIQLTAESEPMIWEAAHQSTAILENVVLKDNQEPDFFDTSLTANTRVAYPRDVIANCVPENKGGVPKSVVFLTCDLYGVLPPVSVLTPQQDLFWFLNGYTALVGSTEVGSAREINPTFSTCFGAAFFPRNPIVYGDLLVQKLQSSKANVYLVNTGWTGGSYVGGGKRFDLAVTRKIIDYIHDGTILAAEKEVFSLFDLSIPSALPGIDAALLNPRKAWQDQAAFEKYCQLLHQSCHKNFSQYEVSQAQTPVGSDQ